MPLPVQPSISRSSWMLRCIAISCLVILIRFRLLVTRNDSYNQYNKFSKNGRNNNNKSTRGNSSIQLATTAYSRPGLYTGEGSSSWTESHSPPISSDQENRNIRISFRLHDPMDVLPPTQFLSVEDYKCVGAFPPSLSGRADLSFITTISTNLNILFLGDSVAQQFAQGFYASVLGEGHRGGHIILDAREKTRSPEHGRAHSALHVDKSLVAPTRGGGVCAYWRALGLMTNRTKGYVDFMGQQGEELVNYRYAYPSGDDANTLVETHTTQNTQTTNFRSEIIHSNTTTTEQIFFEVGKMDACVIRLPHGWIELQDITRDDVVQHISLCNEVVGARTVIISTLPLNNNVKNLSDWQDLTKINQMIRDIARSWDPPSSHGDDGVRVVLVQEFGNFTNQLLWKNAEFIGYDIPMPDFTRDGWEKEGAEFLFHRYTPDQEYAPSIPMVCGHHLENWSTKNETLNMLCKYNILSQDGMHWCIESLGSRYSASIACLLGCVYNGKDPDDNITQSFANVRQCEQECNDRIMSLVPVDESWIGTNTTIFSK